MERKMAISETNSIENYLSYNVRGKTVTKIAVIGDSEVGKTKLLEKLFNTNVSSSYTKTLGFNVLTRKISTNDNQSKLLTFLDFSGQKNLFELRKACYFGIDVIFAVCDVTREETLRNLEDFWIPEFLSVQDSDNQSNTILQIIGTKTDLRSNNMISLYDLDKISKRIVENYPNLDLAGPPILTSANKNDSKTTASTSMVNTKFLFLT